MVKTKVKTTLNQDMLRFAMRVWYQPSAKNCVGLMEAHSENPLKGGMFKVMGIDFSRKTVYINIGKLLKRAVRLSNCMLMQCTGLKDKNGVDIYEGDIIKRTVFNEDICGEVKWKRNGYFVDYYIRMKDKKKTGIRVEITPNNVEVIGNIYENSELIDCP